MHLNFRLVIRNAKEWSRERGGAPQLKQGEENRLEGGTK